MLKTWRWLLALLVVVAMSAPLAAQEKAASPEVDALIRILKDDAARARLIEELSKAGSPPASTTTAAPEPAGKRLFGPPIPKTLDGKGTVVEDTSLAHDLGVYTQGLARDAVDVVTKTWRGIVNFLHILDGSISLDFERIRDQLMSIVYVAIVAFGIWFASRWALRWPAAFLNRTAEGRRFLWRGLMLVALVVAETLLLGFAWTMAVTYLVTYSPGNRIDLISSLFVNAFVLIELIKTGIRAALSPKRPNLRLIPVSDTAARYTSFWLSRLVGWIGYGVLLVFPLVNATVGFAAGLGVRLVIVLSGLIFAVTLILRRKAAVRTYLTGIAGNHEGTAVSVVYLMLAHAWHWLVIGYLMLAFAIWVTRPFDAVSYMAGATLETLLVIAIGAGAINVLSRGIADGIRLSADIRRVIPRLEERLNLLIPSFLRLIRALILIAVLLGILEAWNIINLRAWFDSAGGTEVVTRAISALVILLVAMLIWIATTSWFEFRLNPATGRVSTARARTLFSLFRNAFSILVAVVTAMLVLSQIGIDIAPLIAGAGIIGIAIGFGSQKLVQDIITGAFIQFENAMNEGDVVTVAGISGVVDRLTIRSVGIRDVNGVYHVIPFSSVGSVSNAMRGYAFHVADVAVAYHEDVEKVKRLMSEAFDKLMASDFGAAILEPLEMNGITEFQNNAMIIRARIKTLPGEQWPVGRAYNEYLKAIFSENDIAMPFQQATVWLGKENKQTAETTHPEAAMLMRHARDAAEAEIATDAPPAQPPRRSRRKPRQTIDVPDSPDDKRRDEDDDGEDDDGR